MNDKKTTGFALVPKTEKEPSKIFGIETRTLLAIGALGVGTYFLMTHDPLESEDEALKPDLDKREPDWWKEARENDRIGTRAARGTKRVNVALEDEIDREFEDAADEAEEGERRALEDDEDEDDGNEDDGEEDEEFDL